jgi:hypothetical protein
VPDPTTFATLVTPHRSSVVIHDADADAWINSPATELGANSDGYRIELFTWQDAAPVAIRIVVCDGAPDTGEPSAGRTSEPDAPSDAPWEGERQLTFYSETALVVVEGGFRDGAPQSLILPAPGTYHVRARWRGGHESQKRTQVVLQTAIDENWDTPRTSAALRETGGVEQYRFDLWPSDEPLPDDEDEDE